MTYVLIAIGTVTALLLLNRIGLWAERRGWIYWRQKGRTGGAGGNALLELDVFVNPAAQHVVEAREANHHVEITADNSVNPPGCHP